MGLTYEYMCHFTIHLSYFKNFRIRYVRGQMEYLFRLVIHLAGCTQTPNAKW